ncbi:MAG TPA: TIM barrel protein [Roseiflexaceae bacterium]|nr:TIM barrel protein [Roseiflexaceae bacterium]
MRRLAISTWSLDGLLQSGTPLLDIPSQMAERGITALDLCHFHLPTTESDYLEAFREALRASGVELYRLLIDTGDITAPDPSQHAADIRTIEGWIDQAAALGAGGVRISAGRQPPTPEVVERSAGHLRAFARRAADHGLRTHTENWQATAQEPAALLTILDRCEDRVELCADTGNAEATADKYATLAQLLPRASSIHFKARYAPDGSIVADDLQRSFELIEGANFDGVITLIYENKQREWAGVEQLRDALQPLLDGAA